MALNIPTEGTKLNELKINIVDTQETFEAMKTANKVNANELYFIEQELPIIASSLETGHTLKVNLASENASTAFNGTADITDIGVSGTLPVKHGGTGFTTATYKNAVVIGNSSTVTNPLQTVRTASGAFYATGQDVKPSFGTLPVAQGGTGATSAANARTNLGLGTMATETAANYLKLAGGTMTGGVTFVGNQSSAWNDKGILFTNGSRIGENSSKALGLYSASTFYIRPDSGTASSGKGLEISSTAMIPSVNNEMDLGSSDKKFKAVYATTLNGNLAWSNITSKPTTLSGYGITDAKINNGTITLGSNSITPLTSHQSLSGYIPKSTLSGAYDIMYSSAKDTPTRLAANTTKTKKFLSMTGTGSTGAAPVWDTIDDKTDITVLPNDINQIKTKFRLNNRGNTGNKATAWYYKLCTLPVNNSSNSASLIFSGRLGGYTSGDMSYIQGMAWNRGTPGIAIFDIGGTAAAMARIFEICDIVGYVNGDSIDAQATLTIYILCHGYFTYDLDLELYHSSSTFNYDETYITTVPSGTLAFQASTSNKRVEMINNKLLVNGTEVVTNTGSWNITAKNVSNKLIIGSYEYDGSTTVTIPIYDGTYS